MREDYSESGDAWNYFSHDQARSRAYRWGEDGQLHNLVAVVICGGASSGRTVFQLMEGCE